ncbi:MAG: YihA family ribosome biogenesis GTP-binding protein, partial [Bacteroidales bacterium]|nr:YihA family ribosome biogenesis GTP-binding protein [Bacteroidales bacterium]
KEQREELKRIIESYILKREQLTNLFVLIDSRHEPQTIDTDFITWLGENGVPFSIVFTKADKLSHSQLMGNVHTYKQKLLEEWEELPPIFITSSEKMIGREEVLDYIEQINQSLDK